MEGGHDQTGPVLVVDDDPEVLELVASTLEKMGYAPRTATSYDEALASARDAAPLVAIIDVELPGPSGYDLFKTLREDFGENLPVIFVSGARTEPTDRVAGLLAGGDDYLSKPFDPEELVARVLALLRRVNSN